MFVGFNIIDVAIAVFILIGACIGLIRGFIREMSGIIGCAIAVYVVYIYRDEIALYVYENKLVIWSVYISIGALTYGIMKSFIEYICTGIDNIKFLSITNKILGSFAAAIKVYCLICFGMFLYFASANIDTINFAPEKYMFTEYIIDSINLANNTIITHLPNNKLFLDVQAIMNKIKHHHPQQINDIKLVSNDNNQSNILELAPYDQLEDTGLEQH